MKQLTILFILIAQFVQAQTTPQVCARLLLGSGQDDISWQASPCSGFGGYVVLGQENNIGAFIPLDTVFTTQAVNNNPSESTWNYQVGMLCSGILTNLSVVVNNQPPITPDFTSVSFSGNFPFVSWDPSLSPEVTGYQLYKESPYNSGQFLPYPSNNFIIPSTSYIDIGAQSLLNRYAVVAISACSESLLGFGNAVDGTTGPHTSMVVFGSVDTCNQEILLSWNAYENWKDGVQQYEIWLNKNGSGFAVYDTVSNSTVAYLYKNAQDNDLLTFEIRAIEENKSNYAASNQISFDVRVNRPMDFLHINCLSVTSDNKIEVQWVWDTDVDFLSANLLSGTDSNNLNSRLSLPVIGSSNNNFSDNGVNPKESTQFYKVVSTDACGLVVESDLAETIFLQVEALKNLENKITWSAANIKYGLVQEYWLYKFINGGGQRIATLTSSEFEYIDDLDVTNQAEANNCYFVVASMRINTPNGMNYFCQSQSNKACVAQSSNIHIPNAVSPNGTNRKFRPIIAFSQSISNYTMQIYDRYGQIIFESNDLFDAWDGTKNGEGLKMGMYVYAISFQQPNGEIVERKGTVMLVR